MKDIFIVLPGFNEEKHIFKTIKSVERLGFKNVVFVDDGSSDSSVSEALKTSAVVLRHRVNLGKGSAVKTGCDFAVSKGAKIVILMDSDGQHEAKDIKRFLSKIKSCDVVFGFRSFDKSMPFTMRFGNVFLTFVTRLLFGINVRDTQCGFRCFRASVYDRIRWYSRDYGMESEMIARVARNNLRFSETRISTVYLDKHKGTTPIDGFRVLFNMLRYKFFG